MVTMTLYGRQRKRHRCKKRLLDSVGEGEGGMIGENSIETCILPYVNRSPVQVWCMRQGAQDWCTGMTPREGWVGKWQRGSGWRTHVHPWHIHVNVWQNQYNIVK